VFENWSLIRLFRRTGDEVNNTRCSYEDNIKVDLKEREWEGVYFLLLELTENVKQLSWRNNGNKSYNKTSILLQNYNSRRWRFSWNVGILPQHYTASQPRRPRPEDGVSMDLWNVGTVQHYTASQLTRPRPKDGVSMNLWNVGTLPQHYMASQPIKTSTLIGFVCFRGKVLNVLT
jgi:hypothetical protein